MNGLLIGATDVRLGGPGLPGAACAPIGRTDIRWRDTVGLASLVACPVVLIAYLFLDHGLDLMVGFRAVGSLYVLGVIPGYLAQRMIFGVRAASPFETLLSSMLLGTLLTPVLWYTLCWLGLSSFFAPLMIVLALAVPLVRGWHRQPGARLIGLVTASDAPVLWVALGMTVLWSLPISVVEVQDGRILIMATSDHILHTMLVGELARGVPAATVPYIVGADQWAYHMMPDVWCDLIRRAAGTDAPTAYFYLALPLRYVLLSLACYLALVRRFGRTGAIVGVLCMLTFVGWPKRILFDNWLLTFLHWNVTLAFGLVGVFLILYYVSMTDPVRPRRPLLLAAILSALLLWYKANLALVVAPAVAVVCLIVLVKRRDFRWLGLCLSVQLLLGMVRYVELSSSDVHDTFVMAPLAFVGWWWDKLKIQFPWWGSTKVSVFVNGTVIPAIEALPPLVAWPAKFALLMLRKFHLGLVVLPYLVFRCKFARSRFQAHLVDVLILLILAMCVAGFVFLPVCKGLLWNVSLHLWFLIDALLLALMGPVVVDVVRRLARRGSAVTVVTGVVLLAVCVHNAALLCTSTLPSLRVGREISEDLYASCEYVQAATPTDAVILHPGYRTEHHGPALLMRRRLVLDNGDLWRVFDTERLPHNIAHMMSDLDEFYAGTDPASGRAILQHYGVDYVIVDRSVADPRPDESLLTPSFSRGDVTVYRVTKRPEPAEAS